MQTLVFGIAPVDPASFALAGASLIVVALLAAWIPARRAAAVDPLVALGTSRIADVARDKRGQ